MESTFRSDMLAAYLGVCLDERQIFDVKRVLVADEDGVAKSEDVKKRAEEGKAAAAKKYTQATANHIAAFSANALLVAPQTPQHSTCVCAFHAVNIARGVTAKICQLEWSPDCCTPGAYDLAAW